MAERRTYGSSNDDTKRTVLLKTLRSVLKCHDMDHHGGKHDPSNSETFCRDCQIYIRPPALQMKLR